MNNFLEDLNRRRITKINIKPSLAVEDTIGSAEIVHIEPVLEKEKYEYTEEAIEDESDVVEPIEKIEPEEEEAPIIVAPDSSKEEEVKIEPNEVEVSTPEILENISEIMMEVPLLSRIIECARNEIKTDEGAQQLVDKIEELVKSRGNLTLSDYEEIFESVEEPIDEPVEESVEVKPTEVKSVYKEDMIATNPTTGEMVIYRSGKWRSYNG